ncbi:MAG: KEOPS complex subunit Cgi121 [Thermoplasmata archaeon]
MLDGPADPDEFKNVSLIREDRLVGNMHLDAAIRYALSNYARERMITKSLWNEIIVYASLQRQVKKAFEFMGVKNYTGKIIIVSSENLDGKDAKIGINNDKLTFWNIKDPLEILERMALFHSENL